MFILDSLFRAQWREICLLLHKCYGSGPPDPEDSAQEAFSRFSQIKNMSVYKILKPTLSK